MKILEGYDWLEDVRSLFREYTGWIGRDLTFQHYQEELENLPGSYARLAGWLYLAATKEGLPAGCVALRKLDGTRCELKRLYVCPQYWGTGTGRALAERVLREAGGMGYRTIRHPGHYGRGHRPVPPLGIRGDRALLRQSHGGRRFYGEIITKYGK